MWWETRNQTWKHTKRREASSFIHDVRVRVLVHEYDTSSSTLVIVRVHAVSRYHVISYHFIRAKAHVPQSAVYIPRIAAILIVPVTYYTHVCIVEVAAMQCERYRWVIWDPRITTAQPRSQTATTRTTSTTTKRRQQQQLPFDLIPTYMTASRVLLDCFLSLCTLSQTVFVKIGYTKLQYNWCFLHYS